MNYSIPIDTTIAGQDILDVVTKRKSYTTRNPGNITKIEKRIRAVWVEPDATENDLGILGGFSGRTSFSGTSASVTVAWPQEKNPRTTGGWQQLLTPSDLARIKLFLVAQTSGGEVDMPLLTGVPSPDGISEVYGMNKETIEIRIDDVTGVAARTANYAVPYVSADTVDAVYAASVILPVPFVCLYSTQPVDSCLGRYPNALMAADDVLINQQNNLDPLTGRKRIRYGDRDGRIVYRMVEDPNTGDPFNVEYPYGATDFEYGDAAGGATALVDGLRVEPAFTSFAAPRINPYVDLGSMIALKFARGTVDEVLQVHDLSWRIMPNSERMTLKGRRENTL